MSPRADWRTDAVCRSVDSELFFPVVESGPQYESQVAAAKAVCARCPVQAECLDEAIARMPYGVAGGLTPEERRGRRRRVGSRSAAVLEAGLRPEATRAEAAAAGRVLLTAGRPVAEVARRCRVSERTATRWVRELHAARAEEGSAAATAAPLRISRSNALAGTRITEGRRVY